jgi:hypothetical protein
LPDDPESSCSTVGLLNFYAKEALSQVEHQIWLLRNVFWWYLLPFCISIMAFFVHVSWNSSNSLWDFSLSVGDSGLILLVIYGAIYGVNQYAVRKTLEPRRRDLLKLVASLESESSGEESGDVVDLLAAFKDPTRSGNFSWEAWVANWNQIVPSWRVAAAIIFPTLAGACCGLYSGLFIRIPEMGPVFFQAVVGAVIPFEIAIFSFMYLAFRRKKRTQFASANSEENVPASTIFLKQSGDQQPTRLPGRPALVILVLTVFIGIMAILALMSFSMSTGKPTADPGNVNPDRLVGRYQLTPNFIFDVKLRDGHLMVGITNQATQEVFADSATKWSYRGVAAQLEFHLRAKGPAYALTLHQNGVAQKATRVCE